MSPRTWYAPAALFEILHMDIPAAGKQQILAGNALAMFRAARPPGW
jgi:hypothetical protein